MTTDLYAMGMRARNAIYSCFFLLGFLGLAWIPRIPEIKDSLNLSDGQFGLVLLATTFFVINDISELKIVFTQLIKAVFWAYLIGVFGLFLIMMNRLNFKKYHLFTYLCLTEIIPFLVLTKWVLEFIK